MGEGGAGGARPGPAPSDASTAAGSAAASEELEFGSDLELVVLPVGSGTVAGALQVCDSDAVAPVSKGTGPRGVLEELLGLGMGAGGQHRPDAPPTAPRAAPGGVSRVDDDDDDEDESKARRHLKEGVTLSWLLQWVVTTGSRHGASVEVLETTLCRLLVARAGADAVAAEIVEILGPEALDEVQGLLARREALSDKVCRMVRDAREAETEAGQQDMPLHGRVVTINTAAGKAREKALRKVRRGRGDGRRRRPPTDPLGPRPPPPTSPAAPDSRPSPHHHHHRSQERRRGRGAGTDGDLDWLLSTGLDGMVELEQAEIGATMSLTGTDALGGSAGGDAVFRALPQGTVRKNFKGYEEVHVPPVQKGELREGERLVQISELDDWAQSAFEGYETLNRIQSRIYPTAYHSNENMLVCAPTGAGKTNIAMLSVLHEVGVNIRYGVVQKADFKVVYVAPMKALAGEVTAAFSKRLSKLGLKVRELTGDMSLTKKELAETQMIVTTPEKWDVITRKGGDASVSSMVKLLIIDEVRARGPGPAPAPAESRRPPATRGVGPR